MPAVLAGLACLIGYGVFAAATEASISIDEVIGGLLDWDRAGFLTYPFLFVGIGGLWLRKFLRSGRGAPPAG